MLIGYARVSKADGSQSLDLQRDALRAEGVEAINLYHDLASGVRDDRPGLDSCLRALRKGDVLVVLSTVARKSVILDRTSTTTCRGCISEHRRQEPVWTSVRGAGVKAVSPAERGRSEATRLDVGEHTRTLLA